MSETLRAREEQRIESAVAEIATAVYRLEKAGYSQHAFHSLEGAVSVFSGMRMDMLKAGRAKI